MKTREEHGRRTLAARPGSIVRTRPDLFDAIRRGQGRRLVWDRSRERVFRRTGRPLEEAGVDGILLVVVDRQLDVLLGRHSCSYRRVQQRDKAR